MSLYILDTDHVSLFQRENPLVLERIKKINNEHIAVTVITVQEQMRGWMNVINRYGNTDSLIWSYQGLFDAVKFFYTINILNFDQAVYDIYLKLKSQKRRIGTQDLRIASIALSVDGIVVTRNQKDFGQVPNLGLEDWTIKL